MRDDILSALNGQYDIWARNVESDIDSVVYKLEDFPLCRIFLTNPDNKITCLGCPIRHVTGLRYCDDTPYMKAIEALKNWGEARTEESMMNWKNAASEEALFLANIIGI